MNKILAPADVSKIQQYCSAILAKADDPVEVILAEELVQQLATGANRDVLQMSKAAENVAYRRIVRDYGLEGAKLGATETRPNDVGRIIPLIAAGVGFAIGIGVGYVVAGIIDQALH